MTAFLMGLSTPTKAWAVSLILVRTMEEISSGEKVFLSFLKSTVGRVWEGGQGQRQGREGVCQVGETVCMHGQ